MGWIKANLSEEAHNKLREIVENSDAPTHDVAGEMIEDCIEEKHE